MRRQFQDTGNLASAIGHPPMGALADDRLESLVAFERDFEAMRAERDAALAELDRARHALARQAWKLNYLHAVGTRAGEPTSA